MRIRYHVDKSLPKLVVEATERRTLMKLGRFADAIHEVHVSLKDINGPRGGVDKRCLVRVKLNRGNDVIVQESAREAYEAVSGALDRTTRTVARELQKVTTKAKSRPPLELELQSSLSD